MAVITHHCPPHGFVTTPCCGQYVFDLPRAERLTGDPSRVTCYADMRDLVWLSTCCQAPVAVRGRTTNYWVCVACHTVCDARPAGS